VLPPVLQVYLVRHPGTWGVPETRRASCDLLILVEKPAESVASSDVIDLGVGARAGVWRALGPTAPQPAGPPEPVSGAFAQTWLPLSGAVDGSATRVRRLQPEPDGGRVQQHRVGQVVNHDPHGPGYVPGHAETLVPGAALGGSERAGRVDNPRHLLADVPRVVRDRVRRRPGPVGDGLQVGKLGCGPRPGRPTPRDRP